MHDFNSISESFSLLQSPFTKPLTLAFKKPHPAAPPAPAPTYTTLFPHSTLKCTNPVLPKFPSPPPPFSHRKSSLSPTPPIQSPLTLITFPIHGSMMEGEGSKSQGKGSCLAISAFTRLDWKFFPGFRVMPSAGRREVESQSTVFPCSKNEG